MSVGISLFAIWDDFRDWKVKNISPMADKWEEQDYFHV